MLLTIFFPSGKKKFNLLLICELCLETQTTQGNRKGDDVLLPGALRIYGKSSSRSIFSTVSWASLVQNYLPHFPKFSRGTGLEIKHQGTVQDSRRVLNI